MHVLKHIPSSRLKHFKNLIIINKNAFDIDQIIPQLKVKITLPFNSNVTVCVLLCGL